MEINTVDGRVVNENGQVAVKYYQPVPQVIKVNGRTYVFSVNKSLSIAWVEPEDVNAILNITKVCCGGQRNKVFRLEHETHVKRWLNLIP
jgi:hypothetical protein